MTSKRIVACLDLSDGRVKKGVRFVDMQDSGDAIALASRYEQQGADEIVVLDISATVEARQLALQTIERIASVLFIPLTVGGGIDSLDAAKSTLRAGADKIALNSAAVRDPSLITACAQALGSQAVVLSIDALRTSTGWEVVTHGGRRRTGLDAMTWARSGAALGAGELLLTSIDRDGTRSGYDLELIDAVCSVVSIPVIASGGGAQAIHVSDAFSRRASAALLAGALHTGDLVISDLKRTLAAGGIEVRQC